MKEIDFASDAQLALMSKIGIIAPEPCTKQQASAMIEAKLGKKEEKPASVAPKNNKEIYDDCREGWNSRSAKTPMYVSYAKDIFCALLDNENRVGDETPERFMTTAIKLVKQAKEAFE